MIERCICGCYEYPFLFIDNKENKKKLVVYGKEKDIFKDKRIIIFINNKTSSCAEFIFAIALKIFIKIKYGLWAKIQQELAVLGAKWLLERSIC